MHKSPISTPMPFSKDNIAQIMILKGLLVPQCRLETIKHLISVLYVSFVCLLTEYDRLGSTVLIRGFVIDSYLLRFLLKSHH